MRYYEISGGSGSYMFVDWVKTCELNELEIKQFAQELARTYVFEEFDLILDNCIVDQMVADSWYSVRPITEEEYEETKERDELGHYYLAR